MLVMTSRKSRALCLSPRNLPPRRLLSIWRLPQSRSDHFPPHLAHIPVHRCEGFVDQTDGRELSPDSRDLHKISADIFPRLD